MNAAQIPAGGAIPPRPCPKCEGRGVFQCFKRIQNGVCFRCGGYGYYIKRTRKAKDNSLPQWVKDRQAALEKRAAEKAVRP